MSRELVYIDSAEEQVAYLIARFGPQGSWGVRDQRVATLANGASVERASLETPDGEVSIEFRDATASAISFVERVEEIERTALLNQVMERAAAFAADNPPHHPGSLPRFPIPEEHYPGSVGVPLPILAVDDLGRRGLYAPPRMAVVTWKTQEPLGVREFPGFDPEDWPPRRLGDWPAAGVSSMPQEQLEATIKRFSACWSRIIDAWWQQPNQAPDVLIADVQAALEARAKLDPDTMEPVYRRMNPRFASWLDEIAAR